MPYYVACVVQRELGLPVVSFGSLRYTLPVILNLHDKLRRVKLFLIHIVYIKSHVALFQSQTWALQLLVVESVYPHRVICKQLRSRVRTKTSRAESLVSEVCGTELYYKLTMKNRVQGEKQTNRRQTLDRLCSGSGLLLSIVCCIALIHVELRIQEHHRLISHSVTFCDNMETEILRKVQQYYGRWREMATGGYWQATKGRFRHVNDICSHMTSCVMLGSIFFVQARLV